MAAEDVVTHPPSLSTQTVHPEPGPAAEVAAAAPPLPIPGKEAEDDDGSFRGVLVLDRPRKVLASVPIKVRIDQLPRRKPRVDIDLPRALTDDD